MGPKAYKTTQQFNNSCRVKVEGKGFGNLVDGRTGIHL